jgi:hypothetical protein
MGKWVKGQSGNPGGRPKALGDLRELARRQAPAAIKELGRLALKAKSETARVAAIRELLDRGYGKAGQFFPEVAIEPPEPSDRDVAKVLALLIAEARVNGTAVPELMQLIGELEQSGIELGSLDVLAAKIDFP